MSTLPVTVIRTRNRHSRALLTESGIEIRLAGRLPKSLEQEHIESLTRRMQKMGMKERLKIRIDPFRNFLDGRRSGSIAFPDGERVLIDWTLAPKTNITERAPGHWQLKVGPRATITHIHRMLWRMAAMTERERITDEVHALNRRYGFPIHNVSLRHTTSQWGSCGSKGQICLSTALLFVPKDLREYVIVHELAHLQHRNHGTRFWQLVEEGLPGFREHMKALKNYRVITIR